MQQAEDRFMVVRSPRELPHLADTCLMP